jgi:lipopolysaccharide transport system permease protein
MYLAPIIYPTSLVPESLRGIYFLNPMAVVIDTYRRLVLFGQMPDWAYLFVAIIVSCLVGLAGLLYFKRAERLFADLI